MSAAGKFSIIVAKLMYSLDLLLVSKQLNILVFGMKAHLKTVHGLQLCGRNLISDLNIITALRYEK